MAAAPAAPLPGPRSIPGALWPAIGPPPPPAASARDKAAYYIDLSEKFSSFEERKNAAIKAFKEIAANIATATARIDALLLGRGPTNPALRDKYIDQELNDMAENDLPTKAFIDDANDVALLIVHANRKLVHFYNLTPEGKLQDSSFLIEPDTGDCNDLAKWLAEGSNGEVFTSRELTRAARAAAAAAVGGAGGAAAAAAAAPPPRPFLPGSKIVKESKLDKNPISLIKEWFSSIMPWCASKVVEGVAGFNPRYGIFPEPTEILCDEDIFGNGEPDPAGATSSRNPTLHPAGHARPDKAKYCLRTGRLLETLEQFLNRRALVSDASLTEGILQSLHALATGYKQFNRIVIKIGPCYYTFYFVHGDKKEDNVMIAEDGTIKLIDFGMSQFRIDCWPSLEAAAAFLEIRPEDVILGGDDVAAPAAAAAAAGGAGGGSSSSSSSSAAAAAAAAAVAAAAAPSVAATKTHFLEGMTEYNSWTGKRLPMHDIIQLLSAIIRSRGRGRFSAGLDGFVKIAQEGGGVSDISTVPWFDTYLKIWSKSIATFTLDAFLAFILSEYSRLPAPPAGGVTRTLSGPTIISPYREVSVNALAATARVNSRMNAAAAAAAAAAALAAAEERTRQEARARALEAANERQRQAAAEAVGSPLGSPASVRASVATEAVRRLQVGTLPWSDASLARLAPSPSPVETESLLTMCLRLPDFLSAITAIPVFVCRIIGGGDGFTFHHGIPSARTTGVVATGEIPRATVQGLSSVVEFERTAIQLLADAATMPESEVVQAFLLNPAVATPPAFLSRARAARRAGAGGGGSSSSAAAAAAAAAVAAVGAPPPLPVPVAAGGRPPRPPPGNPIRAAVDGGGGGGVAAPPLSLADQLMAARAATGTGPGTLAKRPPGGGGGNAVGGARRHHRYSHKKRSSTKKARHHSKKQSRRRSSKHTRRNQRI